jgi:ABC-type multidrug transport system fused ATPase/permease subunit
MQRLNLRFYEDKQTGQLMSRLVNDTDLFEQFIAHAVPDMLVNGITLFGVSAVLFYLDWRLALLSMIPIPLVIFSRACMPIAYGLLSECAKKNLAISTQFSTTIFREFARSKPSLEKMLNYSG